MGFAVTVFQLLRTQVRLKLYNLWHNEPLYRRTWYQMPFSRLWERILCTIVHPNFAEFPFRDCMKTPDRRRSGSPLSAENSLTGLQFGVWCYRRPTIGASPTTFHTVSEGEFCEVKHPVYGVLRSSLADCSIRSL